MHSVPAVRILIVCTGNICRSPVAERLLQQGLDRIVPGTVEVYSAGTRAVVGDPIAPYSREIIHQHGANANDFSARQLTRHMLLGTSLILTMSTKQRGAIIRMEPSLHRRTFTIREFGRMLNALGPRAKGQNPSESQSDHGRAEAFWQDLPLKAASVRHLALPTGKESNDVVDPFGLDRPAFKQMEEELVPAVQSILNYTSRHAPGARRAQPPRSPAALAPAPVAVPASASVPMPTPAAASAPAPAPAPAPAYETEPTSNLDLFDDDTEVEPASPAASVPDVKRVQRVRTKIQNGKSRRAKTVLALAGGVVALSAVLAGAFIYNLGKTFDEQSNEIESAFPVEHSRPPETPAMNILVIGSDTEDSPTAEAEEGMPSNQRSDTLMLVHIPEDRKNIYSISLMRDLWVDIPDYGTSKINAALAHGGVPLTVRTVESILHQRIDHVVMVDISGFNRVTEAVGGVDVAIERGFSSSHLPGHTFEEGTHTLEGAEALAFVRERLAFPEGDYQRVRNQQAFLQGFGDKVRDPATLLNPLKITNMVTVMAPFISVDKGLNALAVGVLATEVQRVRPESVAMFTLPTKGTGTSEDGQSIVLPDPESNEKIANALSSDSLDQYLAANPDLRN